MRRNWMRGALALFAALVLAVFVAGCGGPSYAQIGEAGEDTASVLVENGLDEAVTALSVRQAGEDAYPASLMADDASLAAGEVAQLNYELAADLYDIALTTESGQVVEVANVPLGSLEQFAVHFEDEVGFFTYADADGNEVSSKEDALAAKAAAEKLAADQAAADAVAQIALALPVGEDLTLESEDAIVAAREAYEALTDDQKALFSPDALSAIQTAEDALQTAKDEEAARIAAEEEAARIAAEEAAAAEAARQQQQQQTYSAPTYSAPTYSAPTSSAPVQNTDDCTSDTIALRP